MLDYCAQSSQPLSPMSPYHSHDSVLKSTARLIKQLQDAWNEIVHKISPEEATFSNVLVPLAHAENEFALGTHPIIFLAAVSPDPDIREASQQARNVVDEVILEGSDKRLFQLVNSVQEKRFHLNSGDSRLLQTKTDQYARQGLLLTHDQEGEHFRELKKLISKKTLQFRGNLQQDTNFLWLSTAELKDIPSSILEKFEVGQDENTGKLTVAFDYSQITAILRYTRSAKTRQRVFVANENRCAENVALFHSVVTLRNEAAGLLGYASHASLKLVDKMAGTPEVAESFLTDLRTTLANPGKQEMEKLQRLKLEDIVGKDDVGANYYLWDHPYYHRLSLDKLDVDHEHLSEYFPVETLLGKKLLIFEQLLD